MNETLLKKAYTPKYFAYLSEKEFQRKRNRILRNRFLLIGACLLGIVMNIIVSLYAVRIYPATASLFGTVTLMILAVLLYSIFHVFATSENALAKLEEHYYSYR